MLAVAIHCQMLAFQEVLLQVTPETSPREISRISMHTSFDHFTRTRALAIALLTTELMRWRTSPTGSPMRAV
jgi:hypothetical protein